VQWERYAGSNGLRLWASAGAEEAKELAA
jgi:hypothetical protein